MVKIPKSKNSASDQAAPLAQLLSDAVVRDRVVPRFVDSYVIEHGRYGLQVHASLYRDLLNLLQREALLALTAQVLEILCRGIGSKGEHKIPPLSRKEAAAFRQKFLAALTRHQRWNAGTTLEFQSDLKMYEDILSRACSRRRARKPFETANHPFVDRCAFLLDSSFLENARIAASRALTDLESLAAQVTERLFLLPPSR